MRPALLFVAVTTLGACEVDRAQPSGGFHPDGWAERGRAEFHGTWLASHGDRMEDCRTCHGDDYAGGAVGVGCAGGGCHGTTPEACDTCHGSSGNPRPPTGAHVAHAPLCETCHAIPRDARSKSHPDGSVEVKLSGAALANDARPVWDPVAKTCAGVACHGDGTPAWYGGQLGCDGCHGAPPATHARFAAKAPTPASCVTCHPGPESATHDDAKPDLSPMACDTCHGTGPLGVPAPALDGATATSDRAVGAHRRHLDFDLPDRIGRIAQCDDCHDVPASVLEPGHLDDAAPADVRLRHGDTYDATTGRCATGCHFDRDPGPAWSDDSGAARACDACHAMPPAKLRDGTPHAPAAPELSACLSCHDFSPSTHVDGHVDLHP